MKLLITLSVLQTIGIGALIVFAARSGAPSSESQTLHPTSTVPANNSSPGGTTWVLDDRTQLTNESRVRQIIREELRAHDASGKGGNDTANSRPEVADPRAAEKFRVQRDQVAQRIETYKGIGAITEPQMDELQNQIAELDEQNRKQMMSLLIRAMNAGTIKGHL